MMLAFKDHLKDEESKLGQICKSGQKCKQHHANEVHVNQNKSTH